MKKKFLCGALAAAVLLGACPTAAFAADDALQTLTTPLDFRNVAEDSAAEDGSWEWDANSRVLTLKNLRVHVPVGKLEEKAAIILPSDSVLDIEGSRNKIYSQSFHCSAVYCEGDLYVSGDGYLEVETTSYGAAAFYVESGPLVFDEEVEIEVDPAGYIIYLEDARGKDAVISVQDDAKITFPDSSIDRNVTITHKSSVKPSDNWLDYAEIHDYEDRTVSLVEKSKKPSKFKSAEVAEPEVSMLDTYQITIGGLDILKNDTWAYTADVAPYLSNGYTMLPLRALLEVSDPELEVKWNNADKSAYAFVDNKMVTIKPGETFYKKAAERIELATPAETKDGRLFVSLRDWMNIMEIDGSQLKWNSETQTVTLTY